MSKAFISSVNVSGSGSGKVKVKGKGKDNSKSSGNLELNITDITDIDITHGGKVKKNKREKIDLNNLKTIEIVYNIRAGIVVMLCFMICWRSCCMLCQSVHKFVN